MAEMLRAPERDRLIAYLERHLLRSLPLDGREVAALRETHVPFATSEWCWTGDTATAVELLAQPGLRGRWGKLSDRLSELLLAMGQGPLLMRRVAAPECRIVQADPRDFAVVTATHRFTGDLSKGILRQAVREAPNGRPVHYTGHLVEFRIGRQRFCLDVEEAIAEFGVQPQPGGALLFHESVLKAEVGLLRKATKVVGRLRYEYRITAGDPRLQASVTLRAEPGVQLTHIRLTTAVDELSGEPRHPFSQISLTAGGQSRAVTLGDGPLATLQTGATELVSLIEENTPGAALGLHIAPAVPAIVYSVKAQPRDGRLHWLLLRHACDSLGGGAQFQAVEQRLLTAGSATLGLPAYAEILRDPASLAGRDLGLTADHGVALNAVATQLLHAATRAYDPPLPEPRRAELRAWYDRHLDLFFAALGEGTPEGLRGSRVYLRSLAFALVSLTSLHRATGEERYGARLARGLDLLLTLQRPEAEGGAFAEPGQAAYLDNHAAALLALARISLRWPDPRLQEAIARGIAAIRVGQQEVPTEAGLHALETPLVRSRRADGRWEEDGGFWSFKLGLLMRACSAVALAVEQGALALDPATRQALATLQEASFRALRGRVKEVDGTLEIRTSPLAGEGNAATQPTVLLGLTAPDAATLRQAPVSA